MKQLVAVMVVASVLTGCTDSKGTRRALEAAGYSHIEVGGYSWFGCADKDSFATKFKAIGPSGKQVSGAVCSGWLKGNTIRLD